METVYGVELFYRLGRRIELSEVGRSLLTATERLFTMSEETIELLESASGQGTGHLRISAVGPLDVIPVIALVAKANPAARISLTICNSEVAQQSLLEFRADVAMLATAQSDPRFHYVDFGSRPLVLYVNRDHEWAKWRSVRLRDLHGQKLIIREIGSHTRLIFEQACMKAGVILLHPIEINNRDAFREAVAHGLGIGVVADRGLVPDPRLYRLQISDTYIHMDRELACLKERCNSRLIRTFMDTGNEVAQRHDEQDT